MGEKFVYCGKCGTLLRAKDFARGLAHTVEYAHYCAKCKPMATPTMPVSDSDNRYVRSPIARNTRTA